MFEAFFILGLTIIVGYAALYISGRFKISQVLILMLFGFLLGPFFGIVETGEGSLIRTIYPFMAVLALIILLFDGGLSFNIFNVFKSLTKSTLFTFLVFLLNMLLTLLMVPVMGLRITEALLLGAVLGGTSSAIVIAMVDKSKARDEEKSLLTIESTLTDSLTIIFVFIMIQAVGAESFSLGGFANSLLGTFSISILLGVVCAFAWNFLLQRLANQGLDYMLTIAALFIVYAFTEAVQANGALAIFVFGLVFGNMKDIPESFFSTSKYLMGEKIKDFQGEVTFFTRTFFFAYIGMLFPLHSLTFNIFLTGALLTAIFILARYIGYRAVLKNGEFNPEVIIPMLPRGLAAAVVIGVLIENNISLPNIQEVVFTVIFLTNIIATVSLYVFQNGEKKDEKAEPVKKDDEEKPKEKVDVARGKR